MTSPFGDADSVHVAVLPDFSRFAAELRQGVNGAMREMATRVEGALSSVERQVASSGAQLGTDFQRGGEVAERAFHELDATARRELASVDRHVASTAREAGSRFSGMGALVGGAFLGVGVGAAAGLAAITGFGLKAAAEMEQTHVAFNALLGSVQTGEAVFADLQKFAAATPFEFKELTGAAQRFFIFSQATGIAKENVTDFLTILGNVASVTGSGAAGMDRVSLAMGQIASKGRVQQEELMQISEAFIGFNANAAIAAQLGVPTSEAMRRISAGEVDADTALRGLLEGMKKFPGATGAMEKQSQTLMGVWSTFKDTISIAMVGAFAPVIPGIKDTLTQVTPILGDALKGLAPLLGKTLIAILAIIGPLVKGLSAALMPVIAALATAFEGLADSGVLESLGEALGQVFEALGPSLPLLAEFLVTLVTIAVPILQLLALVLQLISPLLDLMARSIHELNRALKMIDWAAIGHAIGDFFTGIGRAIGGFFAGLWHSIGELNERARKNFDTFVATVRERVQAVIDYVRGTPARLVRALGNLAELLVQKGRDMVAGLWEGIVSRGAWLLAKVKSWIWAHTVGAIGDALGIGSPSKVMASEVGRWLPPGIAMGFADALPALRETLAGSARGLPAPAMAGAVAAGMAGAVAAGGDAGASIVFGPGAIVVNFTGGPPTPAQARDAGVQVGQGIMDALARRGIATGARQRA